MQTKTARTVREDTGEGSPGSLSRGQIHTNQLLVIASEHTLLGKGGMAPDNGATKRVVGWFEHVEAVDLSVPLW